MDENIFLSYRVLEGSSWDGREGERRRDAVREMQFEEGRYGEYMYIVPSRRERIRERIGWTQTEKMY